MKVMLTGAFGNIGTHIINALLDNGHKVKCFDRNTPLSQKKAKVYSDKIEIFWGDICNKADIEQALDSIDAVIHMAAIIPPMSEHNVAAAYAVNVEGSNHLIAAMEAHATCKRIVLASSTAIHGSKPDRVLPMTVNEPLSPPDEYSKHKIENETRLKASSLDWTILRIAATPPVDPFGSKGGGPEVLFGLPVNGRFEALHAADAGLAFANAVDCEQAIGKTLFIGGGKANGCQVSGYEFVATLTKGIGLGVLPQKAFSTDAHGAHADWVDTSESQELLNYQRHSLQDLENDIRTNTGLRYYVIKLLSPLIRQLLLKKSPYL